MWPWLSYLVISVSGGLGWLTISSANVIYLILYQDIVDCVLFYIRNIKLVNKLTFKCNRSVWQIPIAVTVSKISINIISIFPIWWKTVNSPWLIFYIQYTKINFVVTSNIIKNIQTYWLIMGTTDWKRFLKNNPLEMIESNCLVKRLKQIKLILLVWLFINN